MCGNVAENPCRALIQIEYLDASQGYKAVEFAQVLFRFCAEEESVIQFTENNER